MANRAEGAAAGDREALQNLFLDVARVLVVFGRRTRAGVPQPPALAARRVAPRAGASASGRTLPALGTGRHRHGHRHPEELARLVELASSVDRFADGEVFTRALSMIYQVNKEGLDFLACYISEYI